MLFVCLRWIFVNVSSSDSLQFLFERLFKMGYTNVKDVLNSTRSVIFLLNNLLRIVSSVVGSAAIINQWSE